MATSSSTSSQNAYRPLALNAFALVAIFIHLWAIFNMLYDFPSWVLRMNLWGLAGILSYSLVFALLESLLVFLPFAVLGLILPSRWRQDYFLPICMVLLITSVFAALALHVYPTWWNHKWQLLVWWIAGNLVLFVLLWRLPRLLAVVHPLTERLGVLVYAYLALDLIGLLVVLVRNL